MKKLSILKKELFFNLGIGISNLILGILSYVNLPKLPSLIILCLSFFPIFFAFLPLIAKTEIEDELSKTIRNEAGHYTLQLGITCLILISSVLSFESIAAVIVKKGIIELIIAYFSFFYCVVYTVLTKRMEKGSEEC